MVYLYYGSKPNGVIYIGFTNYLDSRVVEHKFKINPKSFTAKYNCDKLVYFEEIENEQEANKREQQLKKWKRDWKINLIVEMNPSWSDLSANWSLDILKSRLFR
jgi:putative endonuclease